MHSFSRFFCLVGLAVMATSCGHGIQPVTGVTVSNLRYTGAAGVMTVNLVGDALTASGMRVYANGTFCTNDSSTSETSRHAFCTITVPDDLKVQIRVTNSSGEETYKSDFTSPMPQVTFQTSMGNFTMELNPTKAPVTVKNFLSYVNKSPSFYNATIFHRVIAGFVVQGGGFTAGMVPLTGQSGAITLESNNGLKNERGTVAMAREDAPNTATSQFYINVMTNTALDYVNNSSPGYAVFGAVVSGMSVIDNIASQATTTFAGYNDVPTVDVTVIAASQTQ